MKPALAQEQSVYFRDQLRLARAIALRDAEAFGEIVIVLERLGRFLGRGGGGLKKQRVSLERLASASPLAAEIPRRWPRFHTPFTAQFELLERERNPAIHDGAFARHLTTHAIELALTLEDALMSETDHVADFMVRNPICAAPWHPLSFIRQTLLQNAFSFLPCRGEDGKRRAWMLVSDAAIAAYLRTGGAEQRNERLRQTLTTAGKSGLKLESPWQCAPDATAGAALSESKGLPVLVFNADEAGNLNEDQLVGIVIAFDLL